MSQHQLSAQHTPRGRVAFAILRSLAVGAGLVAMADIAFAADPAPPASAVPGFSDVVLARLVLTALDAEPELRNSNLVVSVVDRIAVIGGPVPNTAVAKRAEQLVRKVEGVRDVRNACFVASTPDPLLRAVADTHGSLLPPRPVMAGLPGVLTNQPTPGLPLPLAAAVAGSEPGASRVVALRPPSAGALNLLGAPVGAPGSGIAAAAPPVVPLTAPGVLTATTPAADKMLAAASEARKADPRFVKLTVELRNGTIVIGGSAPRASDAWDFARKVQALPGVTRVAVGEVNGK